MDHGFWLERWRNGQIGFHNSEVNGMLLRHHAQLGAAARVLVPLCGKSLDMGWLAAQGHEVVGIELSAWYERAALIELPEAMRSRYVEHIARLLSPAARGLLVTLDYSPPVAQGPPFSVDEAEVRARHARDFTVASLERREVLSAEPRFRERGITAMHEQAYALVRRGTHS
mgnify:CR=1 FL=1